MPRLAWHFLFSYFWEMNLAFVALAFNCFARRDLNS